RWSEANGEGVASSGADLSQWWTVFDDPVLSKLVAMAYAQNLSLRAAGVRVLEAQARRGITIGTLFPQTQELTGSYTHIRTSGNTSIVTVNGSSSESFQAGFDAAWEVDLWGKFRRAIEADDASLLVAVASYDDVLVTLVAEVASTYVNVRVLDERLAVARDNARVQEEGLRIARVRFEAGGASQLDAQQATSLLRATEAGVAELERTQSLDSRCVLLGLPPQDLTELLRGSEHVPEVPLSLAVGIPADLLRQRPDIRSAERAAAAQSARIGVAVAELLPAFQLTGSVGLSAEQAARFFEGRSFEAMAGPSFTWPVLNYGRLINNV